MRIGDHWQIFLPAMLGYGPRGTDDGSVPPNQTLIFDMELVKVFTPPPEKKKDDDQRAERRPGKLGRGAEVLRSSAVAAFAAGLMTSSTFAFADDAMLSADASKTYLDNNAKKPGVRVVPGIQYRMIKSGRGAQPGKRDCVTVELSLRQRCSTKPPWARPPASR